MMKREQLHFIPKDKLKHGAYYVGMCRNANVARWDGDKEVFWHWRSRLGSTFPETIKHPFDEDIFDVFYPMEETTKDRIKEIPMEYGNET
jgi:hypothetical protein